MVDALQPRHHVGEDREERDEERADEQRRLRVGRVDQQQRRDRDHRRHLQDHRERKERELDPLALDEDDREPDAADQREGQRAEGDAQRHQQRRRAACRQSVVERRRDIGRAWQDVVRHLVDGRRRAARARMASSSIVERNDDAQHPLGVRGRGGRRSEPRCRCRPRPAAGLARDVAHQCASHVDGFLQRASTPGAVMARYSSEVR